MRKIIQIIKNDSPKCPESIVALCNDGTIWYSFHEWKQNPNTQLLNFNRTIHWIQYDTSELNLISDRK